MIRRLVCRVAHRDVRIDDGPRAKWCPRCGQAVCGLESVERGFVIGNAVASPFAAAACYFAGLWFLAGMFVMAFCLSIGTLRHSTARRGGLR